MKRLLGLPFAPAIAVLNRLTFARKFIVVGLLFSGPLAFLVYLQTSIATRNVDFNKRERTGVAYLAGAHEVLLALERTRVLAAAPESSGQAAALEEAAAALRGAVAGMDLLDGRFGPALDGAGRWRQLRARLVQGATPVEASQAADLAADLESFMVHRVGNDSNLILDPDLDSYWLMDAYVLRLPALAEAVTRGAVLGLSTAAPASADGRWFDLAAEVRLEQSTSLDLEQVDLETAFRETARFGGRTALRATLAPALAKLRAGVTHHAALLREAVGHRDGLASDRPALTQASLEALDQIRGLHQRIGPELDALIAARAERHRAERQDGLVAAGAAAAVLAYLFVAIYLSIRSSMKAVRTSERITSRDELGQIAVAYSQARGEKSRLEEQLRQADRLSSLGMLAAGTAHELNEPLGAILGFAQLARKATGLPEPTLRDLGKIEKAALHAREVVAKLMLFARQAPPQKAPLDLRVVVDEALEFLRPRSEQDGIAIDSDLQAGLPEIVADASQLRQTVLNLVVNALQATARGGSVRVTLRAELSQLRLTVEDQGTGMSEEVRSKLFLPFFTTKDVGQGTGLGLSVVHGIVSAHGGSIEVESAAGRGTRFDVLLPLP